MRASIPQIMEGIATLRVPLLTEMGLGANREQAHSPQGMAIDRKRKMPCNSVNLKAFLSFLVPVVGLDLTTFRL